MQEFELFKKIASEYEGKIVEAPNTISITANNEIASHYQDGTVHTKKVVECTLRIQMYENEDGSKRISFSGEEKTYSILGGFGTTFAEDTFRKQLKRYNFIKKKETQDTQVSIFDLI